MGDPVYLLRTIGVFIIVLGALIVIHEFGHFIVAKFFGIRVDVFSVGFGKRLWGIKKGDTDYRVSLIPLGGYVKMAGENLDEQKTGAPYEFTSKPKWQRLCVAVAGPVMNILTALTIPAAMAMIHYEMPVYVDKPALVYGVERDSPAEKAGLQPGDLIQRINGTENPTWQEVLDSVAVNPDQDVTLLVKRASEIKQVTMHVASSQLDQEKMGDSGLEPAEEKLTVLVVSPGSPAAEAGLKVGDNVVSVNGVPIDQTRRGAQEVISKIRGSQGKPITLTVKRDNATLDITASPRTDDDGEARLGFFQDPRPEMIDGRLSLPAAIKVSINENIRIIQLTKTALAQVFVGKRSARQTFTGPIGIAQIAGEAAQQGPMQVLRLSGLLSLNLGVFNLLPIPVLDGGLIFMLLLESLLGMFGLPLSLRIKERMMQVGLVMLMLLMGFVIFNDISKRFPGRSSSPPAQEQPANK